MEPMCIVGVVYRCSQSCEANNDNVEYRTNEHTNQLRTRTVFPSRSVVCSCLSPAGVGLRYTVTVTPTLNLIPSTLVNRYWSYDPPVLLSVDPPTLPPTGGNRTVTLHGVNFGTEGGSVAVGAARLPCTVLAWSDTAVLCDVGVGVAASAVVELAAWGTVRHAPTHT